MRAKECVQWLLVTGLIVALGVPPGRMDGARSTAGRSSESCASATVGATETADRPAEWSQAQAPAPQVSDRR